MRRESSLALAVAAITAMIAVVVLACGKRASGSAGEPGGAGATPAPGVSSSSSSGPSTFACGAATCDARTSYCELVNTDVQALPATTTCRPLPARCGPDAGCDCFAPPTRCRRFCQRVDTRGVRGFRLVCVGGG